MLTAIELHAPGAFDPDQFACWSLRRPCGGQGERRRHIGLVPVERPAVIVRRSMFGNAPRTYGIKCSRGDAQIGGKSAIHLRFGAGASKLRSPSRTEFGRISKD